ncbi:MAG: hypothetical protein HXS53_00440 [Theionarchaea archaeon]|nr:hypothetical protein [Theionarchaea archaeon]
MEIHTSTGILIGEAPTSENAENIVNHGKKCPYSAHYMSIDTLIMGLFVMPSDHTPWLTYLEDHPDVMGLNRAEVFLTKNVQASSPWSRGEVNPLLERAPCDSPPCTGCPLYTKECNGCPATVYYRG